MEKNVHIDHNLCHRLASTVDNLAFLEGKYDSLSGIRGSNGLYCPRSSKRPDKNPVAYILHARRTPTASASALPGMPLILPAPGVRQHWLPHLVWHPGPHAGAVGTRPAGTPRPRLSTLPQLSPQQSFRSSLEPARRGAPSSPPALAGHHQTVNPQVRALPAAQAGGWPSPGLRAACICIFILHACQGYMANITCVPGLFG